MNGDEHHIVVLIHQLHHLLRGISVGDAHQAREASDAMVGMHYVVAGRKLVQLFQRESHFATPRLVALQVILVKAIEQLVVGKDTQT